jgi:hypothetical protein
LALHIVTGMAQCLRKYITRDLNGITKPIQKHLNMNKALPHLCVFTLATLLSVCVTQPNQAQSPEGSEASALALWPLVYQNKLQYSERTVLMSGWIMLSSNEGALSAFLFENKEAAEVGDRGKMLSLDGFSEWCNYLNIPKDYRSMFHHRFVTIEADFSMSSTESLVIGALKRIQSVEIHNMPAPNLWSVKTVNGSPFGK